MNYEKILHVGQQRYKSLANSTKRTGSNNSVITVEDTTTKQNKFNKQPGKDEEVNKTLNKYNVVEIKNQQS